MRVGGTIDSERQQLKSKCYRFYRFGKRGGKTNGEVLAGKVPAAGADGNRELVFRDDLTKHVGEHSAVLACADDERRAVFLVGDRRVVDRCLRAVGPDRVAAFLAAEHEILDADVGEGAARHDAVVAATRSVGVEILERHATLEEELP